MVFLFDMGEVIIKGVRTLPQIAERYGLEYKEFRADYGLFDKPLMEGFMNPDDYYRHIENKYNIKVDEDLFLTTFNTTDNLPVLSLVDRLRARGHRAVVASNTFAPHWNKMINRPDSPLKHFDALYASHLIARAKPDVAFFLYILEREGVEASDAIFIDDREENIRAAESIGIRSYKYLGDDEELLRFMEEYL